VATSQDLDDPGTASGVAAAVVDVPTLGLLEVLTEADARATGPTAWSPWRQQLVATVVERTRRQLSTDSSGTACQFPAASSRTNRGEARGR